MYITHYRKVKTITLSTSVFANMAYMSIYRYYYNIYSGILIKTNAHNRLVYKDCLDNLENNLASNDDIIAHFDEYSIHNDTISPSDLIVVKSFETLNKNVLTVEYSLKKEYMEMIQSYQELSLNLCDFADHINDYFNEFFKRITK